jgi:hypothetical protein
VLTPGAQTSLWRGAGGASTWLLRLTGAESPSWNLRIRGGARVLVLAVTDEEGFLALEAATGTLGWLGPRAVEGPGRGEAEP